MTAKGILQKDLVKIILYLLATVILAAVLAPPLFWIGKSIAAGLAESSLRENAFFEDLYVSVAEGPFRRYFNRAILVAALVCAWPTVRWIRAGGAKVALGLQSDPRRWVHLIGGFVVAASFLIAMGYLLLRLEFYHWREEPKEMFILKALAAASVIAVLEEFFFRGILMGLVLRTAKPLPTLVGVSVFFALVHFMSPPKEAMLPDDAVTWTSGFWMAGQMLGALANPVFLATSFGILIVVGLILGQARLRTGGLWLSIGLHAGWVFGVKCFGGVSRERGRLQRGDFLPWAGEEMSVGFPVGLIPVIALLLNGILVWLYLRRLPKT